MPTSDSTQSARQGVHLCQVNPDQNEADTNIDIIAIHGLDTRSPDTWTWVDPNDPNKTVNWLADPQMLPSRVGAARIFTCDWPADLLQPSAMVQKTIEEYALLLLDGIKEGVLVTNHIRRESRPVFFIASCLGGIILAKALVVAAEKYLPLRRAVGGIVFLATPFRGTSFRDVAALAEPGLTVWASIQGQEVSTLLNGVKGSTFDLETLVRKFTKLCQDKDHPCLVFNFYEKGKTSLPHKVFPWLPGRLGQEKQLVDESSATLDIVLQPLPLDRPHVLTNKFGGPECADYKKVAGKIQEFVRKIREGTLLAQADIWIRQEHYTLERLKIERLSGDTLPMDQCYINLAIAVGAKNSRYPEEGSEKDAAPHTSSFSLAARLKVETPEKNIQVELSSLFDPRKDSGGRTIEPRRVLIRGRAGVGKTTLCKKMVHDFINCDTWKVLFDRVLWVPLRRLKGWSASLYNLEELFFYEYFAQHRNRITVTKELLRIVESNNKRTLFILDGLDEISQHLDGDNQKFPFLQHLLNQSSVIITSRPHVSLPVGVQPPDLELETIGFYQDQVKEYLHAAFTDPNKVEQIQSYLEAHPLIQDLVRIPIQLDALCYTWDNFGGTTMPQTMTAMYKAIEESLWTKDIVRLEKQTQRQARVARQPEISNSTKDEVYLLEILAFTGMHSDVIDFEPRHRDAISEQHNSARTNLVLDETLGCLSFLRTSDPSSKDRDRNYHFIHLTFQEYFAARYFIRQWKAQQPLKCLQLSKEDGKETDPATFLQEHKYDPRYDIFWRFVAGLLDADGKALSFFMMIEEEPRDLLGPTHQRLLMHCLSEVERKESNFTELRVRLENQLEQWVLFECDFMGSSKLACEMECPEQVLVSTLKQASEDVRSIFLESLSIRTAVPSSVINVTSPWLNDCASKRLCIAVLRFLRHQHNGLPDTILQGIAARLKDQDKDVRRAAIEALQGRAVLTEEMLQGIATGLKDQHESVREAAIEALQGRADLTEEMLQGITARCKDQAWSVQWKAFEVLQGQADLMEEMLQSIAARLKDPKWYVRKAAIEALQGRADLTEEMLQGIAALLRDQEYDVRQTAIKALQGRAVLTEKVLQGIAAGLEDRDKDVRRVTIKVLQGRADLTEEMLQGIAARLKDQDWFVQIAAAEALQGRADLTEEMLQGIVAGLEDQDSDVREAAIKALQGRADLTKEMLQGIAARLKDQKWYLQRVAIETLQGRADLTEEMLQGIAAGLKDQTWGVRQAAIKALQGRADLTKEMLQGIAARLKDQHESVREAAIKALQGRADLTEEMLQGIATGLKDQHESVREAAIKALQGRADLTEEMLQGIAAGLKDQAWSVRRAANKALQGRADLTEEMLQGIMAGLKDQDWGVRKAAIKALQGRADLTKEMLQSIAARLKDQDWNVRRAANKALQGRADLTEKILQGIAAGLKDQIWAVREAATKALQGRADLTEKVLQVIAVGLEDQDKDVRQAAIEALINQAGLSLNALRPYIKPFYKALLAMSFEEHLYWRASDSGFIGVSLRHVSLTGSQHKEKEAVVKLLLQKGAITVVMSRDRRPPLHLVAKNRAEAVVELLLQKGATTVAMSRDRRPLLRLVANARKKGFWPTKLNGDQGS